MQSIANYANQNLSHLLRTNNLNINIPVDNFVAKHGKERISSLVISRSVFTNKVIMKGIDALSPNWKRKNKYDKLYHTYLVINGKYKLNKNQNLTITPFSRYEHHSEQKIVPLTKSLTIYQLLNNTLQAIGRHKMTHYNVVNGNCQDLIISILQANQLLTSSLQDFIKQNTEENITEDLRKTSNTITDIARVIDPILGAMYYTNPLDKTPFRPQG